jgi:hypothetical protein
MTGSLARITIELRYTNSGCPSAGCTWWITNVSAAILVGGISVVGATGAKVVIGLLLIAKDQAMLHPLLKVVKGGCKEGHRPRVRGQRWRPALLAWGFAFDLSVPDRKDR